MKKPINLIIFILLGGINNNCTDTIITPEGLEEIGITKSGQLSKNPIKEYWVSDYMPLIPGLYGIKTYEVTWAEEGEGEQFTSKIIGTETIPYTSGAITGVKIAWGDDFMVLYNECRNFYSLGSGNTGELYVRSTDCELTAYPPDAIIGKVYDGMIYELFEGNPWKVNLKEPYDCHSLGPTENGGTNSGVTLVTIQDVHIYGKRYNNAIILWELEPYITFQELNFFGKEQELGLRLPTSDDTKNQAIDDFTILGHHIGILATGDIELSDGSFDLLVELVSVSHGLH